MRVYEKQVKPKYIRIYEWVHSQIREGRFKVGDKIPTEPNLSKQFGASRMTVRKAIDPLVLEGVVERKPGQGTFVVSSGIIKLTYDASKPMRFSHEMANHDIPHHWEIINRKIMPADPKIRKIFNLEEGEKVVCLTMVLYANHQAVIIERAYFIYDDFPALYDMEINVPPLQLMADRFATPIKTVTQYINAAVAGKRERELFNISYPIPCIYLEWICHSEKGLPFSVSLCHYRSDVFKFKIPTSELVSADIS
ncbi:GntR family transcriptional regulator [Desulfospira joergensenii]|uniref:GntR family transcriptional regulator n=1 Tax=Desulfospira joergensenii TaxID=53329 RepID=UPI0003B41646|nr:GntR family transcriptional regulator [Desulfospira joergensenii]